MLYPEWQNKILMVDLKNRVAKCYKNPNGSIFYVEPGFYKALMSLKALHSAYYTKALNAMEGICLANKVTVFVGEKDNPLVEAPKKAVFVSIFDVAAKIGLSL